jgi:hypothetical protein
MKISVTVLLVTVCACPVRADAPVEILVRYFQAVNSPLAEHSTEFVEAAKRYKIDWRLLPALAMVETAGGRAGVRDYNFFGWGRARFDSAKEAIWTVAEQLGESVMYRGKSTRDKLVVYNRRHRAFPGRVIKVMDAIAPDDGEPPSP